MRFHLHTSGFLIFFLFFGLIRPMKADTIPQTYLGFQGNYGFIIPHSTAIEAISGTKPFGFELSFAKFHTSPNAYKVFNSCWSSGIQIGYFNYQNPEIIGNAYLITLFAEPILTFTRRLQFTIRTGMGISYHTKIFDEALNPANMFFGTHFNFPIFLNLRLKYRTGARTFITISGCYNHISNGGFKQPNKGMNFPTLSAGLEHYMNDISEIKRYPNPELNRRYRDILFSLQALATYKVLEKRDQFPEQRVFVFGLNPRISKQLGRFYALNSGAEIIFDGYVKGTIKREGTNIDYIRAALTGGQEFIFGKVSFLQSLGYYVYSPYKARNEIYQKYELSYRISEKLQFGLFLKAHLQVADIVGFSLSRSWVMKGR